MKIFEMPSLLAVVYIIIQFSESKTETNDDISCHKQTIKNDLPTANSKRHFKDKSIFFLETSCRGGLNSRQACSIESAARAHPKWQINVLFAGPVSSRSQKSKPMSILKRHKNINFFRIHVDKYGKGTPLRRKLANGILNRSYWRVLHTADVLRFLTLYKWGGVHLDLDVIVVEPFDSLAKNWVARERNNYIGSAYIAMSGDKIGRLFANATLRELHKNFDVSNFDSIGPALLQRVMNKICCPPDVTLMSAKRCRGIAVYNNKYFYPIHYPEWKYYFKSGSIDTTLKDVYAHHTWNYLSMKTKVSGNSPFAELAKKYCPNVYKTYRNTYWTIK